MRPAESEVLHEYRHLLRTGSTDWQESAHRHALMALRPDERHRVLRELQRLLLAGTRLSADDVHAVARLIVLAERRRPRTVLDGMTPALLARLAGAVVASPTGRMLAVGLDAWDGADPPPPYEEPPPHDYHQAWFAERSYGWNF